MKKGLKVEMRGKSREELMTLINDEVKEIKKLSLSRLVKRTKNVREIFNKRKRVAWLKTILREKELANV